MSHPSFSLSHSQSAPWLPVSDSSHFSSSLAVSSSAAQLDLPHDAASIPQTSSESSLKPLKPVALSLGLSLPESSTPTVQSPQSFSSLASPSNLAFSFSGGPSLFNPTGSAQPSPTVQSSATSPSSSSVPPVPISSSVPSLPLLDRSAYTYSDEEFSRAADSFRKRLEYLKKPLKTREFYEQHFLSSSVSSPLLSLSDRSQTNSILNNDLFFDVNDAFSPKKWLEEQEKRLKVMSRRERLLLAKGKSIFPQFQSRSTEQVFKEENQREQSQRDREMEEKREKMEEYERKYGVTMASRDGDLSPSAPSPVRSPLRSRASERRIEEVLQKKFHSAYDERDEWRVRAENVENPVLQEMERRKWERKKQENAGNESKASASGWAAFAQSALFSEPNLVQSPTNLLRTAGSGPVDTDTPRTKELDFLEYSAYLAAKDHFTAHSLEFVDSSGLTRAQLNEMKAEKASALAEKRRFQRYQIVHCVDSWWKKRNIVLKPRVSEKLLEKYQRIFYLLDVDSSGSIELNELQIALREIGIPMTMDEVKDIARSIDINFDGTINFDEFVHSLASINEWDTLLKIRQKRKENLQQWKKEKDKLQAQVERVHSAAAIHAKSPSAGPSHSHLRRFSVGDFKIPLLSDASILEQHSEYRQKELDNILLPFLLWVPSWARWKKFESAIKQGRQYDSEAEQAENERQLTKLAAEALKWSEKMDRIEEEKQKERKRTEEEEQSRGQSQSNQQANSAESSPFLRATSATRPKKLTPLGRAGALNSSSPSSSPSPSPLSRKRTGIFSFGASESVANSAPAAAQPKSSLDIANEKAARKGKVSVDKIVAKQKELAALEPMNPEERAELRREIQKLEEKERREKAAQASQEQQMQQTRANQNADSGESAGPPRLGRRRSIVSAAAVLDAPLPSVNPSVSHSAPPALMVPTDGVLRPQASLSFLWRKTREKIKDKIEYEEKLKEEEKQAGWGGQINRPLSQFDRLTSQSMGRRQSIASVQSDNEPAAPVSALDDSDPGPNWSDFDSILNWISGSNRLNSSKRRSSFSVAVNMYDTQAEINLDHHKTDQEKALDSHFQSPLDVSHWIMPRGDSETPHQRRIRELRTVLIENLSILRPWIEEEKRELEQKQEKTLEDIMDKREKEIEMIQQQKQQENAKPNARMRGRRGSIHTVAGAEQIAPEEERKKLLDLMANSSLLREIRNIFSSSSRERQIGKKNRVWLEIRELWSDALAVCDQLVVPNDNQAADAELKAIEETSNRKLLEAEIERRLSEMEEREAIEEAEKARIKAEKAREIIQQKMAKMNIQDAHGSHAHTSKSH